MSSNLLCSREESSTNFLDQLSSGMTQLRYHEEAQHRLFQLSEVKGGSIGELLLPKLGPQFLPMLLHTPAGAAVRMALSRARRRSLLRTGTS